jgi:hypothetical protein
MASQPINAIFLIEIFERALSKRHNPDPSLRREQGGTVYLAETSLQRPMPITASPSISANRFVLNLARSPTKLRPTSPNDVSSSGNLPRAHSLCGKYVR